MNWIRTRSSKAKAAGAMASRVKPLARSRDLVVEEVEDEVLIYDEHGETAHCLSAEAARVWRACDGHTAIDALPDEVGLDADTVTRALTELESRDLFEDAHSDGGLTRRDLTVRVGKVGAAAAAAPLIVSISPAIAEATMTPPPEVCQMYNAQGCSACCRIEGCCCCCQGGGVTPSCKLCFPTALCGDVDCNVGPGTPDPGNCSCEGGDLQPGVSCESLGEMKCGCQYF